MLHERAGAKGASARIVYLVRKAANSVLIDKYTIAGTLDSQHPLSTQVRVALSFANEVLRCRKPFWFKTSTTCSSTSSWISTTCGTYLGIMSCPMR